MASVTRKSPTFHGQLELNVILPVGDCADALTEARPLLTKVEGTLVQALAYVRRIGSLSDEAYSKAAEGYRGAVTVRWGDDPEVSKVPPLARTLMGVAP